jgi:hypothetical protein
MAAKLDLPISKRLDRGRIDLGSGKRVVVKKGMLDKTFNITVPKIDFEIEEP